MKTFIRRVFDQILPTQIWVKPLTVLAKSFIVDIWHGFECVSVLHENSMNVLKECHFRVAGPLKVMKFE